MGVWSRIGVPLKASLRFLKRVTMRATIRILLYRVEGVLLNHEYTLNHTGIPNRFLNSGIFGWLLGVFCKGLVSRTQNLSGDFAPTG